MKEMRILLTLAALVYVARAQTMKAGGVTGYRIDECYGYTETTIFAGDNDWTTAGATATTDTTRHVGIIDNSENASAGAANNPVRKCKFTIELDTSVASTTTPLADATDGYVCMVSTRLVTDVYGGRYDNADADYTGKLDAVLAIGGAADKLMVADTGSPVMAKTAAAATVASSVLWTAEATVQASDGQWAAVNVALSGATTNTALNLAKNLVMCAKADAIAAGATNKQLVTASMPLYPYGAPNGANGAAGGGTSIVLGVADGSGVFTQTNGGDFIFVYQVGTEVWTPAQTGSGGTGKRIRIAFKALAANAALTGACAAKTTEVSDVNVWGLKFTNEPLTTTNGINAIDYGFISFTVVAGAAYATTDGDIMVVTGMGTKQAGTVANLAANGIFMSDMLWTKVPRSSLKTGTAAGAYTTGGAIANTNTVNIQGIITKVKPTAANGLVIGVFENWGGTTVTDDPSSTTTKFSLVCNREAAAETSDIGVDFDAALQTLDTTIDYTVNFGSSRVKVKGAPTGGVYIKPEPVAGYYVYDWTGYIGSTTDVPTAGINRVQSKYVLAARQDNSVYGETSKYEATPIWTRSADDEDFTTWQPCTSFWAAGAFTFSETTPSTAGTMKTYSVWRKGNDASPALGDLTDLTAYTGVNAVAQAGPVIIEQFHATATPNVMTKMLLHTATGWASTTASSASVQTAAVTNNDGWGQATNDRFQYVLSGTSSSVVFANSDNVYIVDKRYVSGTTEGNCDGIDVVGTSVSYIQKLSKDYGWAGTGTLTTDTSDDSKEIGLIDPSASLLAGTYDVYYEKYNNAAAGGYYYPSKQASVTVTITKPTDVLGTLVDKVYFYDISPSDSGNEKSAYTYSTWDGARLGTTKGKVNFKLATGTGYDAPTNADKIALVPSGKGWSPGDGKTMTATVETASNAGGCIQLVPGTSTTFQLGFYKCINYYGPTTYQIWYKSSKASSNWVSQSASFTLQTAVTGKQYVAKARESSSLSMVGTGSFKYGDEEGQDGSTIGVADNGVAAGSFFPTLFNNWGDNYVQADGTSQNIAAAGTLSYQLDYKWASETTMTDVTGTCYIALVAIDPETGADSATAVPYWYDSAWDTETTTTCNLGSFDTWNQAATFSMPEGTFKGGSTYKVSMKIGAGPWTNQSNGGFTMSALNTPSDATQSADFALTDKATGVQVKSTGETVGFTVATGFFDRVALVAYSGTTYASAPNSFGPLAWTAKTPAVHRSLSGQASSTTISIDNLTPGVWEVWGREDKKDWVKLTGAAPVKLEWTPPTTNTPVVSAGGLKFTCSSGCTASATPVASNPTATSYTREWNPFGVSGVQYKSESFDAYQLELTFTAGLNSNSEAYDIYFVKDETATDANFYTTVTTTSASPTETDTDTVADAPGSEVGKNRSPCDPVGRQTSTSISFAISDPTVTNELKTYKTLTTDSSWNYKSFQNDASYVNIYAAATATTPPTRTLADLKAAATSAKFGYFQLGAANCQWANGIKYKWIFPSLGTYQACYRSQTGGYAGRRIYMDGTAPATGETDQRTYIKVSLTVPPVVTSPAGSISASSILAALCVVFAAMLM